MAVDIEELKRTVEVYRRLWFNKTATSEEMKVSRNTVIGRIKKAEELGLIPTGSAPPKEIQAGGVRDESKGDDREIVSYTPRIKTVEELIADRKIDLEQWKIERSVVNQWEMGAKLPDGTIVTTPLVQVKVWLKPRTSDDAKILGQELLDAIANLGPVRKCKPPARRGLLFEFNPADLHIGKLAWREETGEDYDSAIAELACLETLEDCISQLQGEFAQSVLILGNDLLHCDNMESSTTKGTRVDADTRYHKMFRLAKTLMIRVIERMRELAPVRVIVIPGNHDRVSAFTLGEVLGSYYRNDGSVCIDNRPVPRKYFRWGANITGYTHMCNESEKDLPNIMISDVPKDFAECRFRAFRVGHFHKKRERVYNRGDTHGGIEIQVVPSLSGTDAFHFDHGYVGSIKASMGFVIDPERGIRNTITSRPSASLYQPTYLGNNAPRQKAIRPPEFKTVKVR